MFLKKGFLLPELELELGRGAALIVGLTTAGSPLEGCPDGLDFSFGGPLASLVKTWLLVGVVSCGVIS